ncbi:MAG: thrombospondin type 3 repeat-containing protein [Methylococcaceae bacterium]
MERKEIGLGRLILGCVILVEVLCQNVGAETLYMADGAFFRRDDQHTPSVLHTVNTNTGEVTPIGSIGYYVADLAWDRTTKTLYGATSKHDPLHNGLIKIDTNTGAGTPIGTTGWGTGEKMHIVQIDVDSSGNMLGGGKSIDEFIPVPGTDQSNVIRHTLLGIDKKTGTFRYIGAAPHHPPAMKPDGTRDFTVFADGSTSLFFDNENKLWIGSPGGSFLFAMDLVTGTTSAAFDSNTSSLTGGITTKILIKSRGAFDRSTGLYWDLDPNYIFTIHNISNGELVDTIMTPNTDILPDVIKRPALAFANNSVDPVDTDGDGIPNAGDNCINVANANQRDTNSDGFGNMCDGDLDNNLIIDEWDLDLLHGFTDTYDPSSESEDEADRDFSYDPDKDFDGDGEVDAKDDRIFNQMPNKPGPSGLRSL